MDRRQFVKKMGWAGLGIAALNIPGMYTFATGAGHELKKWVWITPEANEDPEFWKQKFAELKKLGIHGALIQVYASQMALYPSAVLPYEVNVLEPAIQAGKETGIEVHAWMWTMPNNNPEYVKNHPNWYVVNRMGEPAHSHPAYVGYYKFMCPNQPEVQEFLRKNVRELAAFGGLSGVHLDYIRFPDVILAEALQPKYNLVQDKEYPQFDYCYCEVCQQKYREATGKDILKEGDFPENNVMWRQFRYDSVTHLVNNILLPEIKSGGKTATAAVFPNWESVRQQWSQWKLDAYFPMLYHNFYNADLQWIGDQLNRQIGELQHVAPVYAGLFLPALDASEFKSSIEIISKTRAAGYSLFAYNNLSEDIKQLM